MGTTEPVRHLVGRIREAIAEDPRTHALDVEVRIAGGRLFLIGQVNSQMRRDAVEEVAREHTPPELTIVNELWVRRYGEPTETERMP